MRRLWVPAEGPSFSLGARWQRGQNWGEASHHRAGNELNVEWEGMRKAGGG